VGACTNVAVNCIFFEGASGVSYFVAEMEALEALEEWGPGFELVDSGTYTEHTYGCGFEALEERIVWVLDCEGDGAIGVSSNVIWVPEPPGLEAEGYRFKLRIEVQGCDKFLR
jgi:hypothetical protein